jgi:predicted aspartyl protease
MIYGNINDNWDLVVPMWILDANEHVHRFDVVVDTGFNGELTLPIHHIREFQLAPGLPTDITMANGATETFDVFFGTLLWRGQRRAVQVVETEGTPLIGIGLLWGSLLTAEMTDNGAVTIGPLPAGVTG